MTYLKTRNLKYSSVLLWQANSENEMCGNEAQMAQKRSASKFRLDNIKYRLHLEAQFWKQYRNPP
jgi:hypothetical protein